jgi:ribosomal protein L37AE/L43A
MSHHPDDAQCLGRSCPNCPDGRLKQIGDLVLECDKCGHNEIGCAHACTKKIDGKIICQLCGEVLQT